LSRLPGKRARPVLRGPRRGNAPGLPDEIFFSIIQKKDPDEILRKINRAKTKANSLTHH
jgi:hypothetical protein